LFLDELSVKTSIAITRGADIKLAIFGLEQLAGVAITAILNVRRLVSVVAEMIVQLGIERRFHGNFGEHLSKVVEIALGLDGFSRLASEGLELFFVHAAYP